MPPRRPRHLRQLRLPCLIALLAFLGWAVPTSRAAAQSERDLLISADTATTWTTDEATVLLLDSGSVPVTITYRDATMSGRRAVVWLTDAPGGRRRADIVLLGNAAIRVGDVERSGEELAIDALVEGRVSVNADNRRANDASSDPAFQRALPLRPTAPLPETTPTVAGRPDSTTRPDPAYTGGDNLDPTTADPAVPVTFQADNLRTLTGPDGRLVVEATGGIFLLQRNASGDLLEVRAGRAVVFTTLERLDDVGDVGPDWRQSVTGVYVEDDVRLTFTPGRERDRGSFGGQEQRLRARRAYYDFTTDRATLTDAVLHTGTGGTLDLPITVRADTIRQLARGRYEAQGAELSTSRFATPSYSLRASRVFVRTDPGVGNAPDRTVFGGDNLTARLFGVPAFYFPLVRGASFDSRLPLRGVSVGNDRNRGVFVLTEWGLWETLGGTPPRSIDATYELGFFSERGPTAALRADYGSDFLLPLNDGQPSVFEGEFLLRGLYDEGLDDLPGNRFDLEPDRYRGRLFAEHRQFFPGGAETGGQDFNLFVRLGLLSDPTYLEVWDRNAFNYGEPHDFLLALERRRGNELLGLDVSIATNNFPTIADRMQENAYVERFPELRYARFGDPLGPFTLTSRTRLGAIAFDRLSDDLDGDFNLRAPVGTNPPAESLAGLPSYGYTGRREATVGRLDVREELSLPIGLGPLRVAPFIVGRFTGYTEDLEGDAVARGLGGVGVRIGMTFARVDDNVYSRLLDLDRARHLIEPYAAGFAGWTNVDRDELFIYDEGVDGYDGFNAAQFGIRQRWQTYRGPAGGQRSVDVFDLDVSANLFDREPDEVSGFDGTLAPSDFRGLYFGTLPEAALPRDTLRGSARYRVSDLTAIIADSTVGADDYELLEAAGGLIVNRGSRLRYSVGGRYVEPLNLLTLDLGGQYELGDRYRLGGGSRIDLETGQLRDSRVAITRQFERAFLDVSLYLDRIDDERGISVVLRPADLAGASIGSNQLFRDD